MYPSTLFPTVIEHLLAKRNGQKSAAMILREAAEKIHGLNKTAELMYSTVSPLGQDEMAQINSFLSSHNYRPDQFENDPAARQVVQNAMNSTKKRIDDLFQNEVAKNGFMTPEMAKNREAMMQEIKDKERYAIRGEGIRNTLKAYQQNPEKFDYLYELSGRSQKALDGTHGPGIGSALGTLAGGAAGFAFGKTPFQRTAFGMPGAAIGGIAGYFGGRKMAENNTGYAYRDVLGPTQISQRMMKQMKYDQKG